MKKVIALVVLVLACACSNADDRSPVDEDVKVQDLVPDAGEDAAPDGAPDAGSEVLDVTPDVPVPDDTEPAGEVDIAPDVFIPFPEGCCETDADCGQGEFCDGNIEACMPVPGEGQCWYDAHCTDGAVCVGEHICPCWGEDVHSCKICRVGCEGPDKMGTCMNLEFSNCCQSDADCWSDDDSDGYDKSCVNPGWGEYWELGVCVYETSYFGAGRCWGDGDCQAGEYCHGMSLCPCLLDCDMDYEGPGVCLPEGDQQCKPVQEHWIQEWCNAASLVFFDGEKCVASCPGCCECTPFCEYTYNTMEECEAACSFDQPPECIVFEGDCDGAIPPAPWWYFDGYSCIKETTCTCENCPGAFESLEQCQQVCKVDSWDECYPLTEEMPDCADPDALPFWYFDGDKCMVIEGCGYSGPGKYDTQLACMQACMGGGQCQIFDGGCDDAIPEFPWYYFNGSECVEEDSCTCGGCPGTYLTMQACEAACGLGGFPEFVGARADCPFVYLIDNLGFGNELWYACMEAPCKTDADCPDLDDAMAGPHCVFGNCVLCWADEQCAQDKLCRAGRCVDDSPECEVTPQCSGFGCRIIHPSERPCPVCVCESVYSMECDDDFACLVISSHQFNGCVYGRCGDCRNDADCEWGRCLQPGICYEMTPPIETLYGTWLIGWAGGMDHFSYFRFEPDGTLRRGKYEWDGPWADDQPNLPCWPDGVDFPMPLLGTWEPEVTQSGFLVVRMNLNVGCDSGAGWTARYNIVPVDGNWYDADFIDVDGDMNYQAFKMGNDVCVPDFSSCQTPTGIY